MRRPTKVKPKRGRYQDLKRSQLRQAREEADAFLDTLSTVDDT